MNNLLVSEKIENMIFEVRGKQVMFSSNVAKLYKVETKRINEVIKRNINIFPKSFYFQLTKEELDDVLCSRSQIVTLNKSKLRGYNIKYLPYVLTEEGVNILSTILRNPSTKNISSKIIAAFEIKNKMLINSPDSTENIRNLIYEVRGKQVMLDSDLALLYECTNGTKDINQAADRNAERFPNDFYFQLTDEEFQFLRFQIGTSKQRNEFRGGRRYLPYVFTEGGVSMLATVLKTEVATKMSVAIIRAFVAMRHYISNNLIEQKYINDLVLKDNKRIDLLEEMFSNFKENNNEIYYEGQIYDAYSKLVDIMNNAKKEVIIIDGYADKSVLDMVSKIKVKVLLICREKSLFKKIQFSI